MRKKMTLFVSIDEVKEYQKLKILSELTLIKEKIKLFQTKYDTTFEKFEKRVKKEKEDYEKWDDYIEWKAYRKTEKSLTKKMAEIDDAQHIEITKNSTNN
jgi:hypothetical protein